MKEQFLKHSLNFITANQNIDSETKEKISYGLEGIYMSITKLIIINLIALFLGIWKEFVLSLILFNFLRFFGFGAHANNSITCLITSSLLLVGIPYLFLKIQLPNYIIYILCGLAVTAFTLYAPADTEKRPLTNKKKRLIRKIVSTILAIIYSIIIILVPNQQLSVLFLSGLIIEAIMILPITYKFLKVPYKNYLKV